jgi:hypothetical protein
LMADSFSDDTSSSESKSGGMSAIIADMMADAQPMRSGDASWSDSDR